VPAAPVVEVDEAVTAGRRLRAVPVAVNGDALDPAVLTDNSGRQDVPYETCSVCAATGSGVVHESVAITGLHGLGHRKALRLWADLAALACPGSRLHQRPCSP
jgi:hypothetical protein